MTRSRMLLIAGAVGVLVMLVLLLRATTDPAAPTAASGSAAAASGANGTKTQRTTPDGPRTSDPDSTRDPSEAEAGLVSQQRSATALRGTVATIVKQCEKQHPTTSPAKLVVTFTPVTEGGVTTATDSGARLTPEGDGQLRQCVVEQMGALAVKDLPGEGAGERTMFSFAIP